MPTNNPSPTAAAATALSNKYSSISSPRSAATAATFTNTINDPDPQQQKQISLVIIRLEVDSSQHYQTKFETTVTEEPNCSSHLTEQPERDIYDIFNYQSAAYLNKQAHSETPDLDEYAAKLDKKRDELLKVLVGKRQPHPIRIETYEFAKMSGGKVTSETLNVALETAYGEWNRHKISPASSAIASNSHAEINRDQQQPPANQPPESSVSDTSVPVVTQPIPIPSSSNETKSKKEEDLNEDVKTTSQKIQEENQKAKSDDNNENSSVKKEIEIAKEDPQDKKIQVADVKPNEQEKTMEKTVKDIDEEKRVSKVEKNRSTTTTKKSEEKIVVVDEKHSSKPKEEKSSSLITQSESDTTEISFYYGNPTVDIVKGFLHIYKDANLTPLMIDESKPVPTSKQSSPARSVPSKRSEMLCMIGIPTNVGCNELLDFIMPFNETIEYMRVVRDNSPNQYMALIKLKSQKEADEFYMHNNNRQFNSIEESVCYLAFVERIEAINSSKGASLPIPGFTELPTCYICLERMDESLNGVITILCNHSFHANCLSKWGDTNCPVCRYMQTPECEMDNMCNECGSHENLWICLICGHVGCGRYVRGHAYEHFQLTQHTYSMQVGNNRVWDYAADNYVHRLIQNKTDGKLVQLDEGGRVINQDEKIDSITLEYTYQLTTQLESQRLFFEEKIQKMEDKYKTQISDMEAKTSRLESENTTLQQNLAQITKEKNNIEKKCSTLTAKVNKMQSELEEEKELNKCLSSNQEVYQGKLAKMEESLKKLSQEKDAEVGELKSQLKDIMFYLDAQSKISELTDVTKEEIDDSQLVIQQNQASGTSANPKRGRKKK